MYVREEPESFRDAGRQALARGGALPAAQTFVARQPIFDERDRVFAYELLFRSGLENYFNNVDTTHDLATSQVISEGAFLGLDMLAQGKLAFVNFSRAPLVNDMALVLPSDRVVIEVLETVEPDRHVVAACERLKSAGYQIALDDFPAEQIGSSAAAARRLREGRLPGHASRHATPAVGTSACPGHPHAGREAGDARGAQ